MGPLEIKGLILGLSVIGGIICIWLGYRLYTKGVFEKGHLSGESGTVKITLQDYGPGVAFALFGAAVIIFAINRPLTMKTTVTSPDGESGQVMVGSPIGALIDDQPDSFADANPSIGSTQQEAVPQKAERLISENETTFF